MPACATSYCTAQGADYSMVRRDADWLSGVVLLPVDIRRLSLQRYAKEHGWDALSEMFAQFVGLAASVVSNSAEMCSMQRVLDGAENPDRRSDRVNMPTLFGALSGVKIAEGVDCERLCSTCAFRIGTPANQSPITTCDAEYCAEPGEQPFMCHEDLNDRGEPTKACAGFAQRRRALHDRYSPDADNEPDDDTKDRHMCMQCGGQGQDIRGVACFWCEGRGYRL